MSDMEWEDLDPIVKTVPWAKAWITVNKDGKPRLNITFSEPAMMDFGHPKKANVMVGTKDGKTMVRMVWKADGKFVVRPMELGGGRIHSIPVKAPVPDGSREQEPCEVVTKTKAEGVFVLPLDAWQAQLNRPMPPPKPAPPPPPPKQGIIEAVVYLRAKGVRISKLAGDWWMLDGNRVPRMEVLGRVNEHRKMAELKPLSVDQIE